MRAIERGVGRSSDPPSPTGRIVRFALLGRPGAARDNGPFGPFRRKSQKSYDEALDYFVQAEGLHPVERR